MKIPEKILERVEEFEKKKKERQVAKKEQKQRDQKMLKDLDDLRSFRFVELMHCADRICCWLNDFVESQDGKRLLRQVGQIGIFSAPFWRGFPVPESRSTTFASISVDKRGNVVYEERYKWHPAHETSLGKIPMSNSNSRLMLVKKLHPDYLAQMDEHLRSEAVWDFIELNLPKVF